MIVTFPMMILEVWKHAVYSCTRTLSVCVSHCDKKNKRNDDYKVYVYW